MKKGLFITLEGSDGCGKTTALEALHQALLKKHNVSLYRDPGSNKISEKIRNIILDANHTDMSYRCEALLYAASRSQLVASQILPDLKAGKVVLCDRYIDSSLVYQGCARELGIDEIYELNAFATDHLMPDITFLLVVDEQIAKSRRENRLTSDRIEKENDDFRLKVAKGYQDIQKKYSNRIVMIDASKTPQEIVAKMLEELNKYGL